MKDIKLSFPYPSTSRHNLSQDVGLSLSMGMVIPVRTIEVLPGDSHRIATSFSLISNPLVKPLLQGVLMRYCRFWVPRRIYHLNMRANNTNFDPQNQRVRTLEWSQSYFPLTGSPSAPILHNDFQQSSLFDYLGYADVNSNFILNSGAFSASEYPPALTPLVPVDDAPSLHLMNAEPYIAYIDICRNYFADSASNLIGWTGFSQPVSGEAAPFHLRTVVQNLAIVDKYIDGVQNSTGLISPLSLSDGSFLLYDGSLTGDLEVQSGPGSFSSKHYGVSHFGFCVPLNRPDRLSRMFDTRPLTSQNATVSSNEVTIANLSFLSKLQRYLTRRFFGGSRYTDIMYSIFGQKVPHVDSPVLLDVFDYELGSELVASTNASETQNPGVLGGYFSASGVLTTSSGSSRRRYSFNEGGYLIDVVYIMPRLFRAGFYADYLPVDSSVSGEPSLPMLQGNFVPDFNGIGWQQPAFNFAARSFGTSPADKAWGYGDSYGFCSEPSWQQYRTLPDVCRGLFNPLRSKPTRGGFAVVDSTLTLNSPLFVFTDRPNGFPFVANINAGAGIGARLLSNLLFTDVNYLNRIFGFDELIYDNIFTVFRYSHQAKRQVTKRFTLTFA